MSINPGVSQYPLASITLTSRPSSSAEKFAPGASIRAMIPSETSTSEVYEGESSPGMTVADTKRMSEEVCEEGGVRGGVSRYVMVV
jgi:hypothetical protein